LPANAFPGSRNPDAAAAPRIEELIINFLREIP
jgi:hypothetical protein